MHHKRRRDRCRSRENEVKSKPGFPQFSVGKRRAEFPYHSERRSRGYRKSIRSAVVERCCLKNAAVFLRKQRLSLKQKAAHRTRHRPRSGKKRPKAKRIENINLHEHELIGYDTLFREIIEELKEVPGIEVFRIAVTCTGRELYAVCLKPEVYRGISVADKASGESAERGDQCKTPCKRGCLNECIVYAAEETFNRRCLQRAAG